jgi:hypothetical protein
MKMTIDISNIKRLSDGSLFFEIDSEEFSNLLDSELDEGLINKHQIVAMFHQTFISQKDKLSTCEIYKEKYEALNKLRLEALDDLCRLEEKVQKMRYPDDVNMGVVLEIKKKLFSILDGML